MRPILTIVDDFLPNPKHIRVSVIERGFKDEMFEGSPYHTVNADYLPNEIPSGICNLYARPVNIHVAAFRQGKAGSPLHNLVHADNTCSDLASVLYLNLPQHTPTDSGTAFWRHKNTGWEHMPTEDQLQGASYSIARFAEDWHNADSWEMVFLARAKFNRLITYPTTAFHSRWPWSGHGTTDEDARLIHAAFFSLI